MRPPSCLQSPRETGGDTLPPPGAEAKAHSERLIAAIRSEMDLHGGVLPFDRYMELALYAPGLGYYMAGSRKLGAEGDFVTAPEISPLFGRCLARQCAQVLRGMADGDVLEFGAGSGALALVLIEDLAKLECLPRRYLILEPSPELRERQRQVVQGLRKELASRFQWLEAMPDHLRGVVIANEVLDAMPVHRFVLQDAAVREVYVRWSGGGFEEFSENMAGSTLNAAVGQLLEEGLELGDGYSSEINLRLGPWLAVLGRTLESGVALLIDYGYPRREYYLSARAMGTLMCHYRHRVHPDPYRFVGLQDITAHVDFTAVGRAGEDAGLTLAGYTTQANFLLSSGLDALLAESDPVDVESHMDMVQGAKRLILPTEMGERFQVLALTREFDEPLLGFALRDLRSRL